MPRFVALLRGVNVGKGNRVPMPAFKLLLQGLGFTDVVTLLNSGNAVFTSTGRSAIKHAEAIGDAITSSLGISVPVVVRSSAELAEVVAHNPIDVAESDHGRLLVAFANESSALRGLESLQALVRTPERFVVGQHAAYLYCPNGVLKSKVGAALLGKPGKAVTTRNWATTLKLLVLSGGSA
jgi:uncharacterized protein (DUF1697 family)